VHIFSEAILYKKIFYQNFL